MCAGCNLYEPWAAIIVGIGAGFSFLLVHFAMLKYRLPYKCKSFQTSCTHILMTGFLDHKPYTIFHDIVILKTLLFGPIICLHRIASVHYSRFQSDQTRIQDYFAGGVRLYMTTLRPRSAFFSPPPPLLPGISSPPQSRIFSFLKGL